MTKRRKSAAVKNLAHLICHDVNGVVVLERKLALDAYYDESVDVIDSAEMRATHRIATIKGTLYSPDGVVFQRFENVYGRRGKLLQWRTEHDDGSVTED